GSRAGLMPIMVDSRRNSDVGPARTLLPRLSLPRTYVGARPLHPYVERVDARALNAARDEVHDVTRAQVGQGTAKRRAEIIARRQRLDNATGFPRQFRVHLRARD